MNKLLSFVLFFSTFLVLSCTFDQGSTYPHSRSSYYGSNETRYTPNFQGSVDLGKSKPAFIGSPTKGEIRLFYAQIYSNGVHLRAKSGAILPQEICVYSLGEDSRYNVVYIRKGQRWWSFHEVPLTPGISTIPNSLTPTEAFSYFQLAFEAEQYSRNKPPVVSQTRSKPPTQPKPKPRSQVSSVKKEEKSKPVEVRHGGGIWYNPYVD